MSRTKEFLQQAARIVILSALAAGTFGVVLAWSGPTAAPPGNNVGGPINISSTAQTKSGSITAGDLCVGGGTACVVANHMLTGGGYTIYTTGAQYINNYYTGSNSCPGYAPNARQIAQFAINSTYYGQTWLCTN